MTKSTVGSTVDLNTMCLLKNPIQLDLDCFGIGLDWIVSDWIEALLVRSAVQVVQLSLQMKVN